MEPRIDFSVDKTEVAAGEIVEIKWKCNGDERSTELTIDNGFRQLTEAVGLSGCKKIRINRASTGEVNITLRATINGKTYSRTITVGVMDNLESVNNAKEIEVYEETQEQERPWWRDLILYATSFLIAIPLFPFIYRLIPDLNWNGFDRFLEFALLYFCVAAVLSIRWWFDLVALGVMLTILTFGTVKGNGYGFKQLAQDYAVYDHSRKHKKELTKYDDKKMEITPLPVNPLQDPLYKRIQAAADYKNPVVRNFAVQQATEEPFATIGDYQYSDDIRQIVHAMSVFKTINENWKYVDDPRGFEYNSRASETIQNRSHGLFTGDCDDHAILMAACIQAVGAKARIVLSHENGEGHAYPELYLGSRDNAETTHYLIEKLFPQHRDREFEYHIDYNGDYWLNMDYTAPYPGGKYLQNRDSIDVVIDI
ncbi:MAG: transglutaminase domain-containing protein [Bacteroidales bacterium]|nr:transglutaminase domain-containing protein [Bacteroidales bacterium]